MKLLLTQNPFFRGITSVLALAGVMAVAPVAQSQAGEEKKPTTADYYEAGRQAFFRDDFASAKPYLIKVLQVKPDHVPSRSMLNVILDAEKKAGAKTSMLAWAKRTIIPSIDIKDAPVEEVIAFLRVKSRSLTNGEWEPNFVLLKPEGEEPPTVTMALREVPVEFVIQTMAEMSGLVVRYEEHAIKVAPQDLLPPEPSELKGTQAVAVEWRENS
ncbi:MAG: hypothetical protein R3F19_16555 [Verrucomicrobiales bacterium]